MDRRQHPTTMVWSTLPLIDDDARHSVPMTYEFAVTARRRWREELNFNFHIALEQHSEFIDEEDVAPVLPWNHRDHFVWVDAAADLGYTIRAVHTPQGKMFCLRFENPNLQAQSVFVPLEDGPEACVVKAREMHFLELEPPKPSPFRAAREADAQRQAQREVDKPCVNLRPGDRKR
jgi:hypothetical protein